MFTDKRLKEHMAQRDNVLRGSGELAWKLSILRGMRSDLTSFFDGLDGYGGLLRWIVCSGLNEYAALRESGELKTLLSMLPVDSSLSFLQNALYCAREDVRKMYPLPEKKQEFLLWFYRHGIDEHHIQHWLDDRELGIYQRLHPEFAGIIEEGSRQISELPFGVNLIGYAYGQLGIGEDLRMCARSLRAVNVPFCIIDFNTSAEVAQTDYSMAEFVEVEAGYRFNIFCMTALENARFYLERGSRIFHNHYNIGYWWWELAKWPTEWLDLTNLVDEIWVSTRHIYEAIAPVSSVPVLIMPSAVGIDHVSPLTRKDFNLPEYAYFFYFSFDLNSSIHRKNPFACLKAFLKAFPRGSQEKVGLLIKCLEPSRPNQDWAKLKHGAAKDSRIHIMEKNLSRPDLLALYKCCDCYVSLHRAEGFGRGIAEAILLGQQVITTGYSGNLEFCQNNPNVHLVPWQPVPVEVEQYPYAEGQFWAEVDLDKTAGIMRSVFLNRSQHKYDTDNFSYNNCGNKYRDRLLFLNQAFV